MAWFKLLLGAARAHPFEAAANRNKSCNFIKATKAATREMRWRDCCQLDGYYYCYYSSSLPWHIAKSSGFSTLDVCGSYMPAPKTLSSLLFWVLTAVKHFVGTPLNGGLTIKYQENLSPHIGMQCNLHIIQISMKILVKLNLASCGKRKALMIMIFIYQILA